MKRILLIGIIFIVTILLVMILPKNDNYIKNGKLYISEIMPSNSYTIKDDDNEYSDYIEIYNGYNKPINLVDFMLSDSEYKTDKWSFPEIIIEPHEYLIVFASGKNKCDLDKKICHTNFRLSSDGEIVTLTDDANNILSKVSYEKLSNDVAFGFYKNKYYAFEKATPGSKNIKDKLKKVNIKDYKITINEYMTHNKRNNYLSNGAYYDWIELYNYSDKDINLDGLYLSDNKKELNKFKLPDVVIKKNDYLVIYLTDGINVDGYVCANFKLSDNDKIVLSNNSEIIEEISVVMLPDNVSYGKVDDKWQYFTSATPGYANTTKGLDSLGGANGST